LETSSKDPLASAAEGVTKGFLHWTEEKIKGYVARFQNKDIAFVSDPEIINLAKKQRETPEWKLFEQYVEDRDLRILFQMGLTLRKIAIKRKHFTPLRGIKRKPKRFISLRSAILSKYGTKGLHIAQFIQNGHFGKIIGNILDRASTPEKLRKEIEGILNNIELTTIFIKQHDDVNKKAEEVVIKILANYPSTFIIFASGNAIIQSEIIKEKVMKNISGYEVEIYKTRYKKIHFINKV